MVHMCYVVGKTLPSQHLLGKRRVSKTERTLAEAERIAAAIVADLAPSCARIQVAGSVRRRKELVGDIEIVAVPRHAPAGLFGDCTANLLWEHLRANDAYRFTKGDHAAGRYYQLALPMHAGLQVDLFPGAARQLGPDAARPHRECRAQHGDAGAREAAARHRARPARQ